MNSKAADSPLSSDRHTEISGGTPNIGLNPKYVYAKSES
jgi:hypothetical protein